MAVTNKITIFFETDNYTWSESYWSAAFQDQNPIPDVSAIALVTARAQLLGEYATIFAVRKTSTRNKRSAQYLAPGSYPFQSGTFGAGALGGNTAPADRPYSSLIVDYFDSAGHTTRAYMSGIPDNIIGETGGQSFGILPQFGIIWAPLFNAWIAALTQGWAWRAQDPTVFQLASGWATVVGPNGEIGVVTPAAINFPAYPVGPRKPKIITNGYTKVNTRLPTLSGQYFVDVSAPGYPPTVTPFQYYLRKTSSVNQTNTVQTGFVGPVSWLWYDYAGGQAYRATHRKRGGTAFLPRGRSRTRS